MAKYINSCLLEKAIVGVAVVLTACALTVPLSAKEIDSPLSVTPISKDSLSQLPLGPSTTVSYANGQLSSIEQHFSLPDPGKPSIVIKQRFDTAHKLTGLDVSQGSITDAVNSSYSQTFGYSDPSNPYSFVDTNLLTPAVPGGKLDMSVEDALEELRQDNSLQKTLLPQVNFIDTSTITINEQGIPVNTEAQFPVFTPGQYGSVSVDLLNHLWTDGFKGHLNVPSTVTDFRHDQIFINGQMCPLTQPTVSFTVPSTTGNRFPFLVFSPQNDLIGFGTLPSYPGGRLQPDFVTAIPPLMNFWMPHVGQAGRPITIYGPFSGNLNNTQITFNGDSVPVQVETSNSVMFTLPSSIYGTTGLHLDDGPNHIKNQFSSLGIKLIGSMRILQPGESEAFQVKVLGLQSLLHPATVHVMDLDSGIASMAGGNTQTFTVTPADGADVTKDYALTGVQRGACDVIGFVPQQYDGTPYPVTPSPTPPPTTQPGTDTGATTTDGDVTPPRR